MAEMCDEDRAVLARYEQMIPKCEEIEDALEVLKKHFGHDWVFVKIEDNPRAREFFWHYVEDQLYADIERTKILRLLGYNEFNELERTRRNILDSFLKNTTKGENP